MSPGVLRRAGWALRVVPAVLAVVVLAVVVLAVVAMRAGDEAAAEVRWRVPLEAPSGGAVLALATCYEALPRHVALTLTPAGREVLATSGAWLAEKAAVLQLVCMTGRLKGWLSWDVPPGDVEGVEGFEGAV